MSESQSRYSIVERLTDTKLEIMSSKASLKEQITAKKQTVADLEKDLDNWSKDIQQDIERTRRQKTIAIEKAKRDLDNAQEILVEKEKVITEKIETIDKALKSIEEISKSAGVQI